MRIPIALKPALSLSLLAMGLMLAPSGALGATPPQFGIANFQAYSCANFELRGGPAVRRPLHPGRRDPV